MSNSKFNALYGLSVGSTPVDVIDSSGVLNPAALPASGVAAGTYNSVTVDAAGRVTAGSTSGASGGGSSGPGSYVVGDPVFSMQSKAQNGQTVTVSAKALSLLNGPAIASLTFVTPAGTVTINATAGVASTTFTASGSVDSTITISAFATDVLGNISRTSTYTVTISSSYVNKATISSPTTGATLVENGLTITTSAFGATGTTDTLASVEFEAWSGPLATGSLIWSGSSTTLTKTVPDNSIAAGTTVYLRARHVGTILGYGQWSDDVQVTTAPVLTPSSYGAAYQGGFYAGRITLNGSLYALVVAPASTETSLAAYYSTTAGTLTTQAKSLIDGLGNTNELIANDATSWYAAKYCYDLTTGGYTDWYLPALLELELMYRLFKPTEQTNITTAPSSDIISNSTTTWTGSLSSYQTYSTPAATTYTNSGSVALNPPMTSVQAFQGASVQEGFATTTYWSSSGPSGSAVGRENMAYFSFGAGDANGSGSVSGAAAYTTNVRRVRAVRRVYLRAA